MGLLNFIVDAGQDGHLRRHDEEIEELKKKTELLYEWVQYLNAQLKENEDEKQVR